MSTPIVDSHIHLFPASHLPTLSWYEPDSPLGAQHSVDQYRLASSSIPTTKGPTHSKYLRGFIFLETDRISSVAEDGSPENPGWKHALDEVSLLTRIALGQPLPGEGHQHGDQDLCLGIVPWAPVPGGPEVLGAYMAKVKERTRTEQVWRKVRGVRYLLQDEPAGVMLQQGFVDGLRWLGGEGLTFDLGVDARQGGLGQLREAVEMMNRVYRGVQDDEVTIVISEPFLRYFIYTVCRPANSYLADHLCKPNLRLSPETVPTHAEYLGWRDLITKMARASSKTYMKLSGAFSEMPPLTAERDRKSVV